MQDTNMNAMYGQQMAYIPMQEMNQIPNLTVPSFYPQTQVQFYPPTPASYFVVAPPMVAPPQETAPKSAAKDIEQQEAPMPSTTCITWGSVFACLCCFWPLGLIAIIFSCQARSRARAGDLRGAWNAAGIAKRLIWLSVLVGSIVSIFAILYYLYAIVSFAEHLEDKRPQGIEMHADGNDVVQYDNQNAM
eukprot:TRINITY_DN169_c0_g1_i1.p1 TRINITY_DN169_c0_g1~~TRINITY_DN169_c0_g1_i1.p1  ORF type:complete len:190 (-),score=21.28 TRINITY_DN169_c0_g1_i1:175-744(-)